ncbi:aldehyde-activating protein [Vibrio sp. SS-MA-C1-2]|uniref:GFA family protein n=1 Tax=Vibrio sp. SS-MA-C1-2 TaxID=2908646 RepID=UPI001F4574FF|nr:aldehyde-activating protein [Vibrio sp. SS-MA-C1-2]UJF16910.1 aldehyde-activating protein [Vibrio sp. SS-MA-C1-2]
MHVGQCHCGNIKLSIQQLTETATSCNCSICIRYQALWGYFTESQVLLSIGLHGINHYCQGDKMINFYACPHCFCVTHYRSSTPTENSRFAVNYHLFDTQLIQHSTMKIKHFDGANSWQYIN